VPKHKAARRRSRNQAWSRERSNADSRADAEEFRLSMAVPVLVKIASDLSGFGSGDVAREIVGLDLIFSGDEAREARRIVASSLSANEIDAALKEIDEPDVRIQVLGDISDLGPTPARIEILCQDLLRVVCWPMCARSLVRAVDNLWSRQVAEAAVRAIATVKWPEYDERTGD
jgi:hypothetical protein